MLLQAWLDLSFSTPLWLTGALPYSRRLVLTLHDEMSYSVSYLEGLTGVK